MIFWICSYGALLTECKRRARRTTQARKDEKGKRIVAGTPAQYFENRFWGARCALKWGVCNHPAPNQTPWTLILLSKDVNLPKSHTPFHTISIPYSLSYEYLNILSFEIDSRGGLTLILIYLFNWNNASQKEYPLP